MILASRVGSGVIRMCGSTDAASLDPDLHLVPGGNNVAVTAGFRKDVIMPGDFSICPGRLQQGEAPVSADADPTSTVSATVRLLTDRSTFTARHS